MPPPDDHPLLGLAPEDLTMIASFVLVSGSIKDLAREYGVSYPTMRSRLNDLIGRLKRRVNGEAIDPFDECVANLIAAGEITPRAARTIRDAHRDAAGRPAAGAAHGGNDDA